MTDREEVARIEANGRIALPALEETAVGDWLVRLSCGATKRVNSANPIHPNAALGDARNMAERIYAQAEMPCRFRMTPLARPEVDATLADAGYALIDPSTTMVASAGQCSPDPSVAIATHVDEGWLKASQHLQARSDAESGIQAQLLRAIPGPLALASIEEAGETVASAYASVGSYCAQISDVVVAELARGRGLGRTIVEALMGWAWTCGCGEAMLQVQQRNVPALALYRRLGFSDAYYYHYRVKV